MQNSICYPAVFHAAEDTGGYWVEFPDLPGCITEGNTEEEAEERAREALSLFLDMSGEDCEYEFSMPSSLADIQEKYPGEAVRLIEGDPGYYARKYSA